MKRSKFFVTCATLCVGVLVMTAASCDPEATLNDEQKVQQIAGIIKSGTQIGVSTVVLNDPESVKHFNTAVVALKAAIGGDNLEPDEILETVKSYLTSDPESSAYYPLIESGIGLALASYRTFYDQNVDGNVKPYLKTLLVAITEGIELGVAQPAVAGGEVSSNPILQLTVEDLTL
jgi:hypothetical protein